MEQLVCYACKKEKLCSDFHKDNRSKRGYQHKCKDCRRNKVGMNIESYFNYQNNYYEKNKEKRILNQKENYKRNKVARALWSKKYRDTVDYRYAHYKKDSKVRSLAFDLTIEEFEKITSQRCFYCDEFHDTKEYCGIDRVDNNIGYVLNNLVPCCEFCNFSKRDNAQDYFLDKVKKIYLKQVKEKISDAETSSGS